MIALGVLLILFFVIAAYASLNGREDSARTRKRGPVKDPKSAAVIEGQIFGNIAGFSVGSAGRNLVARWS
jgi:hypothetical protein